MPRRGQAGNSSKPGPQHSGRGQRELKVGVKTARGRRLSSTRWLQRQLNDPYVRRATREGYRSRAAFKLMQIDDRFRLLRPGNTVLDLGAAPGGWSQVAADRVNALRSQVARPIGKVFAVDLMAMEPLAGVVQLQLDMTDQGSIQAIQACIGGGVDVVLCDMATPSSGHRRTDHLRVVALGEAAAHMALQLLRPNGAFVTKVLQGGAERELLTLLKCGFGQVSHLKPPASRADSAEQYVVARKFRAGRLMREGDLPIADAIRGYG